MPFEATDSIRRKRVRPAMRWRWMVALGLATAVSVAGPLWAQTAAVSSAPAALASEVEAGIAPPRTAIDSVEHADEVIRDVAGQRTAVAARYAREQQACSSVFFMTRCLDEARERRRAALASLRPPEIEANAFKRRDRVTERDKAIEEKRLKSEQEATPEQHALKIGEPRKAGEPADTPGRAGTGEPGAGSSGVRAVKPSAAPRPDSTAVPRRPKPLTAPISAATEAGNKTSFDKKAAESAERQRVLSERKVEKERDKAEKKARAAASAASVKPGSP